KLRQMTCRFRDVTCLQVNRSRWKFHSAKLQKHLTNPSSVSKMRLWKHFRKLRLNSLPIFTIREFILLEVDQCFAGSINVFHKRPIFRCTSLKIRFAPWSVEQEWR